MIDAAAIAAHWRSPPITARCAIGRAGIRKASTTTASGSGASAITATCIAFKLARWMLRVSISGGSIAATVQAIALAAIRS